MTVTLTVAALATAATGDRPLDVSVLESSLEIAWDLQVLPATSGRHGGCALVNGGGGKILRVNIRTGATWPGTKWIKSRFPLARRTYTCRRSDLLQRARQLPSAPRGCHGS